MDDIPQNFTVRLLRRCSWLETPREPDHPETDSSFCHLQLCLHPLPFISLGQVLLAGTPQNPTAENLTRVAPIDAADQRWHMITISSQPNNQPGYRCGDTLARLELPQGSISHLGLRFGLSGRLLTCQMTSEELMPCTFVVFLEFTAPRFYCSCHAHSSYSWSSQRLDSISQ